MMRPGNTTISLREEREDATRDRPGQTKRRCYKRQTRTDKEKMLQETDQDRQDTTRDAEEVEEEEDTTD
jgi:hypothetical protein